MIQLHALFSCAGIRAGFEVFIHAVFYIGKGKRSRPYEHFKEAVTYFRQTVKRKVRVQVKLCRLDLFVCIDRSDFYILLQIGFN